MTDSPLISCIVPVFNGERYLGEALDSIFAQTYRPLEVIVVDDGSTDGTPDVVARYGEQVAYLKQANAGPAAARNRGLSVAKGEFVAFLDADDLWHEEKLARQMARFRARPELELCITHIKNFWVPELKHEEERLRNTPVARDQPGSSQTWLARRALFERVGMFDATLVHRDVMDWMMRLRRQGGVSETLNEVLVYRRIHKNNLNRQRSTFEDELLSMAKSSLDRRRT